MNPNKTIRPWLLAAGKQFGIRQAHDYVWDAAETRQHETYCTYRLLSCELRQLTQADRSTKTNYTAHRKYVKNIRTTAQVDLYHCADGLNVLADMALAANANPVIREFLSSQGVEFEAFTSITNLTPDPAPGNEAEREETYHHRMISTWKDNAEHSLDDENAIVTTIEMQTFADMNTWEIDENGYREKT